MLSQPILRMQARRSLYALARCAARPVTTARQHFTCRPALVRAPVATLSASIRCFSLPAPVAPPSAAADLSAPLVVRGGIASRPLRWAELERAVSTQDWHGLGRLAEVQQAYNEHRQRVLAEWNSMGDFVLHEVFGTKRIQELPSASAASGHKGKFFVKFRGGTEALQGSATKADPCLVPLSPSAASESARSASTSAAPSPCLPPSLPFMVKWTPNSFPYAVEDGVHHDLLWVSQGHAVSDEALEAEIEKRFPAERYETLKFVNPVENRSVKEVYHAHVFWREKKSNKQQQHATATDAADAAEAPLAEEQEQGGRRQAAA